MSVCLLAATLLVCLCGVGGVSVRRLQNVSVSCELGSGAVVAWFRLSSGRVEPLLWASRGRLSAARLIVEHNLEHRHFILQDDGLTLLILNLTHADLGLYYCATGPSASALSYGSTVSLTLADVGPSADGAGRALLIWACVSCGVGGFLCASLLFYCRGGTRVSALRRGKDSSEGQLQYSSLRWLRRSRARPAPPSVTYASVAKHTHTHDTHSRSGV